MSVQAISWVLDSSQAEGTDRLVLIVLANEASTHGDDVRQTAWPSVATIARKAHVSERTVQRSLRSLEQLGELATEPFEGWGGRPDRCPNVYVIVGMEQRGDNVTPRDDDGVTAVAGRGDKPGTHGVTTVSPDPETDPVDTHTRPIGFPTAEAVRLRRSSYPDAFAAFWDAYPRHVGKHAAYKAWLARIADARKQTVAVDRRVLAMTTAAVNYAVDCEDRRRSEEHIMHASTFLGPQDRWREYVRPAPERLRDEVPSWATGQRSTA